MPRPPRLELPGVAHHVIQRGNNRGACFFGDADRRFYLKCLEHAAQHRRCEVHAYVLMSNHVHLLVTPLDPGALGAMMQELSGRYVRVINRIQARTGTLWEARFRSSLVDSENYLLVCQRYIELSPVRAGLVDDPAAFTLVEPRVLCRQSCEPSYHRAPGLSPPGTC
jgi:REP-associated tyrosine transposase